MGLHYAPDVSPDPFANRASSLEVFRGALDDLVISKRRPAPGSPAATEAEDQRYAGEWGRYHPRTCSRRCSSHAVARQPATKVARLSL
jgi:hypothetical protein